MNIIAVPFGYLMRFCYTITHNYALALIFFTLFFKLIFIFLNIKQQKSAQAQARVRPKERAIRKRYEGRTDQNARIEMSNDLMAMYKEEKVSIASGCFPMLIQLPIVYILYQIVRMPLTYLCRFSAETISSIKNTIFGMGQLLPADIQALINSAAGDPSKFKIDEIQMVSVINSNTAYFDGIIDTSVIPDFTIFGGAIDLSVAPTFLSISVIIPILVGLFQFASSMVIRLFGPKPDLSTPEAAQTAKTMLYTNIIMVAVTVFIAFTVPAILGVYWIYQSIIGAVIQIILSKIYPIPTFTEEEMLAIETEYNKDYVRPVIASSRRSLHHIDDDDYDEDGSEEDTDGDQNEAEALSDEEEQITKEEPELPKRRLYDKNGNRIRSLHYIDEDDDIPEAADNRTDEDQTVTSEEVSDAHAESDDGTELPEQTDNSSDKEKRE